MSSDTEAQAGESVTNEIFPCLSIIWRLSSYGISSYNTFSSLAFQSPLQNPLVNSELIVSGEMFGREESEAAHMSLVLKLKPKITWKILDITGKYSVP